LATDPSIGILFNHAFSRIGIELNTIGVFGEITGNPLVSVTGLELATGSINLLDGSITAGANYTPTLSYLDFENVDPAFNDAKIAYVYTASTAEQTFSVSVQNLTIQHADGNLARTYFATAAPFRSEEHTSELQSRENLVCRLLLEKKKKKLKKEFNFSKHKL